MTNSTRWMPLYGLVAFLIAGLFLLADRLPGRYQIVASSDTWVHRLNTRTGELTLWTTVREGRQPPFAVQYVGVSQEPRR